MIITLFEKFMIFFFTSRNNPYFYIISIAYFLLFVENKHDCSVQAIQECTCHGKTQQPCNEYT